MGGGSGGSDPGRKKGQVGIRSIAKMIDVKNSFWWFCAGGNLACSARSG